MEISEPISWSVCVKRVYKPSEKRALAIIVHIIKHDSGAGNPSLVPMICDYLGVAGLVIHYSDGSRFVPNFDLVTDKNLQNYISGKHSPSLDLVKIIHAFVQMYCEENSIDEIEFEKYLTFS